jgi:hypothetical protein
MNPDWIEILTEAGFERIDDNLPDSYRQDWERYVNEDGEVTQYISFGDEYDAPRTFVVGDADYADWLRGDTTAELVSGIAWLDTLWP